MSFMFYLDIIIGKFEFLFNSSTVCINIIAQYYFVFQFYNYHRASTIINQKDKKGEWDGTDLYGL